MSLATTELFTIAESRLPFLSAECAQSHSAIPQEVINFLLSDSILVLKSSRIIFQNEFRLLA